MAVAAVTRRFWLVLGIDCFLAACCALVPLGKVLSSGHNVEALLLHDIWRDTNLDIMCGIFLRCAIYLWVQLWILKRRRVSDEEESRGLRKKAAFFVIILHHTFQIGLLAKMISVAAHGESGALPDAKALHPGLVAIFCSCLSFLLFGFIEKWMTLNTIRGGRYLREPSAENSFHEYLLSPESSGEKRHSKTELLHGLLKFLFQDIYPLIAGISVALLAAVAEAMVPFLTGRALKYVALPGGLESFRWSLIGLTLVAIASGALMGIQAGVLEFTAARVGMRLRTKFFYHLLQQEVGFFDVVKTGELISRLHTDIGAASDMVSQNVTVMIRSLLHIIVLALFMVITCWRLSVVSFALFIFTETVSKFYGEYFAQFHKEIQSELAGASIVVEETLASLKTVRAHAAEEAMVSTYKERMKAYFHLRKRVSLYFCGWVASMTWAPKVVMAVALYLGGYMVLDGRMSAGDLVAFMLYQQALSQQSICLMDFMSPVTQAFGAVDKVLELMRRRPKVHPAEGLVPMQSPRSIELRNVHFGYPSRPDLTVLSGLSLTVSPGEVVAIVGPSGSGKSTVFNLLQRFYLPEYGDVVIDGRDVGVYAPSWLKHNVGLVPEEHEFFAKSIKDNILLGVEADCDMEAAVEAASRLAGLHEFVMTLPENYNMECGENGVQLSKTQKWKLAVARSIVHNPSILLVDGMPSLEFDDENSLEEILEGICEGRTVVIITENVKIAEKADRIIVMKNGKVVESGSHLELMDITEGTYATLVGSTVG